MTSPSPEAGAAPASPSSSAVVTTPPRVSKLAAALQPSVPTQELAESIQSLAGELAQDLEIRLEGDAPGQVAQAMSEIDLSDTKSILFFGTKAQQQLSGVSDMMLVEVRT
jgi:uncharacterized protein YaaN involved in tellurite resistance